MKYELTITLKPMLYQFSAMKQFELTKEVLLAILEPFNVTAVAELTGEHNVHYHCVVSLDDIHHKNRLMNRFRGHTRTFGRKSCTQVMYEESYKKYIRKSLDETKEILGDPIIRDYFSVFQTIF
jgi:hypothetical protein